MDVLCVSDPGIEKRTIECGWIRPLGHNKLVPGLLVIGNQRAAIILGRERWENRVDKKGTRYSKTGRSLRIRVRLAAGCVLWIICTYIHHSPDQYETEVREEWAWIQCQVEQARQDHATVVVGGDFNTFQEEMLDRQGQGIRSGRAVAMSRHFQKWTQDMAVVSTFRVRHQNMQRYTYERGGVQSTLDDIYISQEHQRSVGSNGVWLRSIQSSDHVGVAFAELWMDRGGIVPLTLKGIRPIKVVNTRKKMPDDMAMFTTHTQQLLDAGRIQLCRDTVNEETPTQAIQMWLEKAIHNLYADLYKSGRVLWGEQNQSQRRLARFVSIKKSNRCTAQLRQLSKLTETIGVTSIAVKEAIDAIQWPRWIIDPASLAPGCAHENRSKELQCMLRHIPNVDSVPILTMWIRRACNLWKKIMKTRRNWRQTLRNREARENRARLFTGREFRRFLHATLAKPPPSVTIRSTMVHDEGSERYSEDRNDVQAELVGLLNQMNRLSDHVI
ncbi:hypothetical protein PHMEG_00026615 [Phytophthora megakarya]|uniref:Endonuclease/exonuclease/phosphatase domain-containing protein n=1 Tax=Phytophthora megakarya TaxID=4795 RepID=A0A225VAE0_9STRA|nr:hypothetical protein PHMEG_00026615 [Phytophthora megakarya]